MNESLRPIALILVLVAVVAAAAGCGSDKDDPAAKRLLADAFGRSIGSADVSLELTADLKGNSQLDKPVRVQLTGPYQTNGDGKLPDAQWDISIAGGGQTFSFGFLSTADQAFVNFQGTSYRLSDKTVAAVSGAPKKNDGGGLRQGIRERFGVDPLAWVKGAKQEDDASVSGVPTRHVSADIDVKRVLRDLNTIVSKTAGAPKPGKPAPRLTDDQIDAAARVVHDPRFDVYVGKADGKIRRLSVDLAFDVPEKSRARLGGLEGGTISLDVELAAVGQPKHVEPPRSSRPIAELVRQLGGLGGVGGLLGLGQPPAAGGGGAGSPPSAEQLKAYSQCLEKAKPSDQAAIDRCATLLK